MGRLFAGAAEGRLPVLDLLLLLDGELLPQVWNTDVQLEQTEV